MSTLWVKRTGRKSINEVVREVPGQFSLVRVCVLVDRTFLKSTLLRTWYGVYHDILLNETDGSYLC